MKWKIWKWVLIWVMFSIVVNSVSFNYRNPCPDVCAKDDLNYETYYTDSPMLYPILLSFIPFIEFARDYESCRCSVVHDRVVTIIPAELSEYNSRCQRCFEDWDLFCDLHCDCIESEPLELYTGYYIAKRQDGDGGREFVNLTKEEYDSMIEGAIDNETYEFKVALLQGECLEVKAK